MTRLMLAFTAYMLLCLPLYSEDKPVVVELYTSQGCSSCPPADEMMEILADREDVIALSLHVDYWDYIGWTDEFADPKNAKRQRTYAASAGRRSVYTPQMIVNGVSDIVGAKPMELATAIEKHKADRTSVELSIERLSGTVSIAAQVVKGVLEPMDVSMVRYQPQRTASITRGENAGRTIKYMNVTQDWQHLTRWNGREPLELQADAPGEFPVVVLIQTIEQGPILAAARLR